MEICSSLARPAEEFTGDGRENGDTTQKGRVHPVLLLIGPLILLVACIFLLAPGQAAHFRYLAVAVLCGMATVLWWLIGFWASGQLNFDSRFEMCDVPDGSRLVTSYTLFPISNWCRLPGREPWNLTPPWVNPVLIALVVTGSVAFALFLRGAIATDLRPKR